MSEERNDQEWQHVMDYRDEVGYQRNTLIIPDGMDKMMCVHNFQVIVLGDVVWWEKFGCMGTVQRIQHWDRWGGYDVLTIETQRTFIREAMADEVIVMTKGQHGYSIPI